jgi:MFS family permease
LIRIGVAVGEAGCNPPAFSLIADYFARRERPRAVARYTLGWPLALLLGFFAGGWLNQFYGWRTTFVILGTPGLALAALAALTLNEPRRSSDTAAQQSNPATTQANPAPRFSETFAVLWTNTTYRHLLFGFSLSYFFGNGILQWLPAFFVRSHGFASGELGSWFAAIYGLGGLLGTWLGGEWVARFAADNERRQLRAMTGLFGVFAVVAAAVYLASDRHLALAVLAISAIGSGLLTGPAFAATQTIVPPHMRAVSIAILLFFCNLIGLGMGPLAAGALSDALRPWFGEESLRYALLALCPGYFWCAWHLWRASRTVTGDVAAAVEAEERQLAHV